MKVRYMNSQIEFHEKYMDDFLKAEEDSMKIAIMDRTEALYGGDWTIDKEWCNKNGVPYSQGKLIQNTGCIIAVKGNILLDVKKKFTGGECLCDIFSKKIVQYFKDRGMNSVRQDNNDVLVDDFKVASGAEVTLPGGYHYIAYQISINQDLDIIRHACLKPMVKVPKALSEYDITTEEMVKFCEDYWLNV